VQSAAGSDYIAGVASRDEHPSWVRRVVAAISLVDVGTLDTAASQLLGAVDHAGERVTVIGVAGQRSGVQHKLASGRAPVGRHDRRLDAELVGAAGFALADAFGLGGVEGIELPAALALPLGADLGGS